MENLFRAEVTGGSIIEARFFNILHGFESVDKTKDKLIQILKRFDEDYNVLHIDPETFAFLVMTNVACPVTMKIGNKDVISDITDNNDTYTKNYIWAKN